LKDLLLQTLNNIKIFLYSLEGKVADITVKPDLTIENIKKLAIMHFYGEDINKPISYYRLIHSGNFKQLVDENHINDENINEYGNYLNYILIYL